jgi:hypothetical protein
MPAQPECPHGRKEYDDDLDGLWLCPAGRCLPELVSPGYPPPAALPAQRKTARVVPVAKTEWELAVINCPDVKKTCLAVALVVGRFATWDNGMECRISQAHVASCVGLKSLNAVGPHLRWLTETGWLHIHREPVFGKSEGENRPREYWLTIPKCDHAHDGSALPRVSS